MLRAAFVAMRQALCLFLLAHFDQVELTAAQECPNEADFDFSSVAMAYDGGECGHFCRADNWCIDGHNIAGYSDKTLTECACACQSNSACVSFDWRDVAGYNCALQDTRSSEVSHATGCIAYGWSYFEKVTISILDTDVDGCALYIAGPVVASKSNQVATVEPLQDYELSFTMELASDWSLTGNWQNILHIGDTDGQRFPGVWFHPTENKIYVFQSQSYCSGCCCDWEVYSTNIFAAGETYEIKVIVENNQMAMYVDGALVGTESGSATYVATDAAVYVGDPWWDTATKVTLSDITLSEVALADVCRENIAGTTTTGSFTVQEGRCYAHDQMSSITTGGSYCWGGCCARETAQECYTCCDGDVGPSGVNAIGVQITYNPNAHTPSSQYSCRCKRLSGTDKRIQN
jgi:hypothetical protein